VIHPDRVSSRGGLPDDAQGRDVLGEARSVEAHIRDLTGVPAGVPLPESASRGRPMMLWRSFTPVAVGLAAALVLGLLFDDRVAAWWLAGCLVVLALYHTVHLTQIHYWAALPRQRELPLGSGPWALLLDRLSRSVRQEREARQELTGELERIHSAVDQLPDGLVVLDRYDHVQWANNAAEDLHGIFGRGRPIHHFIRQPEFVAYLEARAGGKPVTMTLPARPGRTYELRLYPVGDGQRLLIGRDITDHAKLDAMRRDFVANVSHEIRTPVCVIGGMAQRLLDQDLDDGTRREHIGTILRQSQTMQRLIEDLLTLSSLENSATPPTEEVIDMGALLNAMADEARALSRGRHAIEVEIATSTRMRGAAAEIEGAVRNLLTNAIRYTPDEGRIALSWQIRDNEGWVTVRDTGIGIAAEHLPRMSERFYRVERDRSRETGGTGLGLAIVKHVLQRHHGRLGISSEPGLGSVFSLRFPAERLVAADEETIAD
jgi:two-component system phosphate regulon sensor histidine kinase PhoR